MPAANCGAFDAPHTGSGQRQDAQRSSRYGSSSAGWRVDQGTKPHITIKEVAARANVSLATASRAFGGRGSISVATKKRVHQAARELGYKPHGAARSLKLRRTHTIGLMITDIVNPFYAHLASSVLSCAKRRGYHVILCATDEDPALEKEALNVLIEKRVDGVLAVPTGRNVQLWRDVVTFGIPVVFVDRELARMPAADSVLVANRVGARAVTTYLIQLGHSRIGMISGPTSTTTGQERLRGYYEALAQAGLPIDPALVHIGSFKRESGLEAAERLLGLGLDQRPTALFAANNVLAESALFAIRERGLLIPGDISLVLFDDVPWASLSQPALTAVSQPTQELGAVAVEQLLQRLQASRPQEVRYERAMLASTLIVRDSCAPPAGFLAVSAV